MMMIMTQRGNANDNDVNYNECLHKCCASTVLKTFTH